MIRSVIHLQLGGSTGQCKHFCAVVSYINSPESADSKTNHSKEWGKPSRRQLLEYDKGMRMSKLFTPPPYCHKDLKLLPLKLESLDFPGDLSGSPLCTMINIDKRNESEIIAAESLVALIKVSEQRDLKIEVSIVIQEVLQLQLLNAVYSHEILIASDIHEFYANEVCYTSGLWEKDVGFLTIKNGTNINDLKLMFK